MFVQVTAKNVGGVFFETQCRSIMQQLYHMRHLDRVATKWEKKLCEFALGFSRAIIVLLQRLLQQKVYVIMTFIYQGSFHINFSSITGHHWTLTIMILFTQSVVLCKYSIILKQLCVFVCYNFSLRLDRMPRVFHLQRNPWLSQVCGHPVITMHTPYRWNRQKHTASGFYCQNICVILHHSTLYTNVTIHNTACKKWTSSLKLVIILVQCRYSEIAQRIFKYSNIQYKSYTG